MPQKQSYIIHLHHLRSRNLVLLQRSPAQELRIPLVRTSGIPDVFDGKSALRGILEISPVFLAYLIFLLRCVSRPNPQKLACLLRKSKERNELPANLLTLTFRSFGRPRGDSNLRLTAQEHRPEHMFDNLCSNLIGVTLENVDYMLFF